MFRNGEKRREKKTTILGAPIYREQSTILWAGVDGAPKIVVFFLFVSRHFGTF